MHKGRKQVIEGKKENVDRSKSIYILRAKIFVQYIYRI